LDCIGVHPARAGEEFGLPDARGERLPATREQNNSWSPSAVVPSSRWTRTPPFAGFDGLLVHLRADFDVELLAVHSQQLVPERGVGVDAGSLVINR